MSHVNHATLANATASSWRKDPGLRANMIRIFILYSAVYALGYDGSLLNGLQALTPWQRDFNAPKGYSLGLISASYYLPKIPTAFIVPIVADRYGRKIPLYIGSFFMLAGAIFGGLAHGRGQLIGSRVFLGVGTAFGQITAAAFVPELAHPRLRHMSGSFLNVTYFVGSIFSAWLTFGMVYIGSTSYSWRIPTLVQGLGPIILGVGVLFIPESPRWLLSKGRTDEAHQILARFHANGKLDDELVLWELKEIQDAIVKEKLSNAASWFAFFNSIGGRRRFGIIVMLGTATQWVGNGVLSFYLVPVLKQVGITKPAQTAGINGGLSIWSFIVALTGASLVEKVGRRPLFLISLSGMTVCFAVMTGVAGGYASTKNVATGTAIVPIIFLFNAFYALAFTPLPILVVPEISPLAMRAKASALLLLSQNIAQAVNQFVNPIALAAIAWRYYFVYVATLVMYLALFYFFLRETRGLTTEQAAVVYDSEPDSALSTELEMARSTSNLDDEKKAGAESLRHVERS